MIKNLLFTFFLFIYSSQTHSKELFSGEGVGVAESKREACDYALSLARKARGYKTFRNYRNIVYLLVGKLDFARVNCKISNV